jgi:hypothetical protein
MSDVRIAERGFRGWRIEAEAHDNTLMLLDGTPVIDRFVDLPGLLGGVRERGQVGS